MTKGNSFSVLIFFLILGAGIGLAIIPQGGIFGSTGASITIAAFVIALVVSTAINVANQWERLSSSG